MLKDVLTIVGNIGGFIAIANLLWTLWERRLNVSVSLFDIWDEPAIPADGGKPATIHNVHIVISNNSGQPISVLVLKLLASKIEFEVNSDRGYLMTKKYSDYSYPIFRDGFPVNIPAKASVNLRLQVMGDPVWNQIDEAKITTSNRTKIVPLRKANMRLVNRYQFR
ncbi:hypothetical protein [Lacticaseibacillus paracasei]|uniref:hypothetical protein n=1 Tax=Lacticaseibacillus paracasei TaxID=1597 RepID=UPI00404595CA